jgi:thiol-disulfide isomerase/thioredoxin
LDSLKKAPKKVEKWEANVVPGTPLKQFSFMNSDTTIFNTKDIPANKNVVLMLFNPTCEHCMEQTKLFLERKKEFENTFFLLITGDQMMEYAGDFKKGSGFIEQANWKMGFDVNKATDELFAYKALPQIMLYSVDKKLLTVFYKDTKLNDILEAFDKDPNAKPLQYKDYSEKKKTSKSIFKFNKKKK